MSDILPYDVLELIWLQVEPVTIMNMCSTDKNLQVIGQQESFWKKYTEKHFPLYAGKLVDDSWRKTALLLSVDRKIYVVPALRVHADPEYYIINSKMTMGELTRDLVSKYSSINDSGSMLMIYISCQEYIPEAVYKIYLTYNNTPLYAIETPDSGVNLYLNMKTILI